MAFGFPPKYAEELPLSNLTDGQFLVLAIAAAKTLEWSISEVNGKGFIAFTGISWSSYGEKVEVSIEGDVPVLKSQCTGSQIMDHGRNEKNVKALINEVHGLLNSFTTEELDAKYHEIQSNPVQANLNKRPKFKNFLSIFIPVEGYFITPILIDLNIAIYLLMVAFGVNFMLPTTESLITWGANFRPMTLEGQWWRLLTNCFLHIGVFHLLMNMYALAYIGLMLEHHLGRVRYLAAYLLTGIIASMTSVSFHELIVSAGASGAIFGMYGVFLAMLTTNLIDKAERSVMFKSILIFVLYNLMYGMKAGIDNAAHIGGLISGLAIGYAYLPGLKRVENTAVRDITIVALTVVAIIGCYVASFRIPNDVGKYYSEIQKFTALEAKAIESTKNSSIKTQEQKLFDIRYGAIYNWDALISLISNLDTLNLPPRIHSRNQMLLDYCNLRLRLSELHYNSIKNNTSDFQDSVAWYNEQITRSLASLKEEPK